MRRVSKLWAFNGQYMSLLGALRSGLQARQHVVDFRIAPSTLPDLVRQGKQISETYSLYEFMVDSWLQRERSWIDEGKLRALSTSLAVSLYCKQSAGGDDRMAPEELDRLCGAVGLDVPRWQLTQRSLLNRDSHGNLKFAHRSILEYLFVSAAIDHDDRCFTVPWTNEMRRLFLSWGRTAAASIPATFSLIARDHRVTRLLPLYDEQLERPSSLSLREIKNLLSVPGQPVGAMPLHWHIACLSGVTTSDTVTVIDVAYDTTWTAVNISAMPMPDARCQHIAGYRNGHSCRTLRGRFARRPERRSALPHRSPSDAGRGVRIGRRGSYAPFG